MFLLVTIPLSNRIFSYYILKLAFCVPTVGVVFWITTTVIVLNEASVIVQELSGLSSYSYVLELAIVYVVEALCSNISSVIIE